MQDEVTVKPNRDKKTMPRLGKHWCHGCDASYKGESERCQICGLKPISKRRKK